MIIVCYVKMIPVDAMLLHWKFVQTSFETPCMQYCKQNVNSAAEKLSGRRYSNEDNDKPSSNDKIPEKIEEKQKNISELIKKLAIYSLELF